MEVSQPRQTVTKRRVTGNCRVEWAALGAFWLLALGGIAIYSLNFRTVIEAGNPFERNIRMAATASSSAQRDAIEALARQAPPLMLDPDSYSWISIAQQQAQEGRFRTRTVTSDNAPKGRAMHWSTSFSWWLILLGAVTYGLTGMALPQAIAASAAWANPILFALFLTGLMWTLRRRANVWVVGVLAVTLTHLSGVSWDFGYARPDHHGLHQIAFLGMLLALLAAGLGWVRYRAEGGGRTGVCDRSRSDNAECGEDEAEEDGWLLARAPSPVTARRWFAVSGFFGGMGLWIGATQQMFLIGAAGAGAALGILFFARPALMSAKIDRGTRFMPVLWRHWGQVGAATSFAFYLLEYFPNHLRMRLEVNHPLYALAFLGGGELLCALGRWRACMGEEDMECRLKRGVALGLACLSILPLAVLCGPRDWYVLREPILLRMMRTVTEGLPFIEHWTALGFLREIWQNFGALPLALPLAAVALFARREIPPRLRAALLVGTCAAAVCLGWMLIQSRWTGLASAALAVLAVLIIPAAWGWNRRALPWGLLALTAPGWVGFWLIHSQTYGDPPMQHVSALLPDSLADEELGWIIRLRADEAHLLAPRVMAPMGAAPALHYFSGANTVGSLYWENVVGCLALADFYGDAGDAAAARRIARERGLNFVVAITHPVFVQQMQWLKFGNVQNATAHQTLAFRLSNPINPQPPDWLEPVSLQDAPLAERGFRLYRVRRDRL